MKTPISALQEMMVTLGPKPVYNWIAERSSGKNITFVFECVALGISVTGEGRKKQEAKQEAARTMLLYLRDTCGYELDSYIVGIDTQVEPKFSDYISLVKEKCEKNHWAGVNYELESATGPEHMRHFLVRANFGAVTRHGVARTIKAARQMAAHKIYNYIHDLDQELPPRIKTD